MNQTIKGLWLAALQSGRYRRARSALRYIEPMVEDDAPQAALHCCLGVLCEIAAENGAGTWDTSEPRTSSSFHSPASSQDSPYYNGIDSARAYLPDGVAEWAGLSYGEQVNLASLNDSAEGYAYPEKVLEAIRSL